MGVIMSSLQKGRYSVFCHLEKAALNEDTAYLLRQACLQGDVLSGSLAVMVAWAQEYAAADSGETSFPGKLSPLMIASYGGSLVARYAQQAAFKKCQRSMLAEDVINELGVTVDTLF